MSLRAVARYAIEYARDGFPLLPEAADTVASVSALFRAAWPTSAPKL